MLATLVVLGRLVLLWAGPDIGFALSVSEGKLIIF